MGDAVGAPKLLSPLGLLAAALVSVSGCAPRLAGDWAETNALVAARAENGGYLAAANELMTHGEYELAMRGYTRAIREAGLSGPVVGGLGAANLQLDRQGQARSLLERGSRIEPQSVSIWNNLGVVLATGGDSRAAGDAFTLARSLAPATDGAVQANLRHLKGEPLPAAPKSAFPLVRHETGLYLILESASDEDPDATDDVL